MSENIFKELRLKHTKETVMRGAGKKIPVEKPLSQTKLAKELHISQSTLDKAEKNGTASFSTIEAYHDYFKIPYSTLLGETECEKTHNVHINMELGLSDDSISTLKSLSTVSLSMLNVFLGHGEKTELFFYNLANIIYSMTEQLKQNGNTKNDYGYMQLRQMSQDLFMDYMKNITFHDLKKVLLEMEAQQEALVRDENSTQHTID